VIVIVVLLEFASTTVVKEDPVQAVVTFIVAVFPVEVLAPDTL
jgi:hypothetical protein